MFTQDDMRFYVEPSFDQSVESTRIYCLDTRNSHRQAEYIGKVVNVRPLRERIQGRAWAVTEDGGNYVFGPPLIRGEDIRYTSQGPVVAPFDDGFIVGDGLMSVDGPSEEYAVNHPRDSRRIIPINPGFALPAEWAVNAASWARELMPKLDDTEEVLILKLELAKEQYKQRRAFNHLHEEAIGRGWGDTMKGLRERNDTIPEAVYSASVVASVYVSADVDSVGTLVANSMVTGASSRADGTGFGTAVPSPRANPQVGSLVERSFSVPAVHGSSTAEVEMAARAVWTSNVGRAMPIVSLTHTLNLAGLK